METTSVAESLLNYQETLQTNQLYNNPKDMGVCLNNISTIYTEEGDYDKAIKYL